MRQGLTHSTVGPDQLDVCSTGTHIPTFSEIETIRSNPQIDALGPFGIEEPTSFLTFPKFDGGAQFAGGWRNWQSPWSPKEVFHL